MNRLLHSSLILFSAILLFSCNEEIGFNSAVIETDPVVSVNPTGVSPLTARITFRTSARVSVEIKVPGLRGEDSDVIQQFPLRNEHRVDVFGLYPGFDNRVEMRLIDEEGLDIETQVFVIRTRELIADLPEITINTYDENNYEPGLNFVNYFGFDENFNPQRPFMFDQFGDIRWYLDYSENPVLAGMFYDNGMNVLQNGNIFFGDASTSAIHEIDRYGNIINTWGLQGYGFHHHVIEKPDGNFLVTVNDLSKNTVEDVIIEISRLNGQIAQIWDLNESLDNQRRAWPTDLADLDIDWFHGNGLAFDEKADAIIVSGRTQGTVKLTDDNEVIWILAPHKEWETSGRGEDLQQYLLQPLDRSGQPITDESVLSGETNHPSFEWPWYQHSPIIMPNGNLLLFDNGDNRNYVSPGTYSRAVEYEIDEQNMTIQQVWSYGKDRGAEMYSRIVSKVGHLPKKDNVLISAGAVLTNGLGSGKVVEVDYLGNEVYFEATVVPPNAPFNIAFHNVNRVPLYNPN